MRNGRMSLYYWQNENSSFVWPFVMVDHSLSVFLGLYLGLPRVEHIHNPFSMKMHKHIECARCSPPSLTCQYCSLYGYYLLTKDDSACNSLSSFVIRNAITCFFLISFVRY